MVTVRSCYCLFLNRSLHLSSIIISLQVKHFEIQPVPYIILLMMKSSYFEFILQFVLTFELLSKARKSVQTYGNSANVFTQIIIFSLKKVDDSRRENESKRKKEPQIPRPRFQKK